MNKRWPIISYSKRIIRKAKFRRFILVVNVCLAILVIIIFVKNFQDNKKKIEYEQKIANLQQSNIKLTQNIQTENREIKTYYVSADGISSDGTDINNPMSLSGQIRKHIMETKKFFLKEGIYSMEL